MITEISSKQRRIVLNKDEDFDMGSVYTED